jgi:hypothetical protein
MVWSSMILLLAKGRGTYALATNRAREDLYLESFIFSLERANFPLPPLQFESKRRVDSY